MNYYDRIQPRCLPPEAYLRLWQSAAANSKGPKIARTIYPSKPTLKLEDKK